MSQHSNMLISLYTSVSNELNGLHSVFHGGTVADLWMSWWSWSNGTAKSAKPTLVNDYFFYPQNYFFAAYNSRTVKTSVYKLSHDSDTAVSATSHLSVCSLRPRRFMCWDYFEQCSIIINSLRSSFMLSKNIPFLTRSLFYIYIKIVVQNTKKIAVCQCFVNWLIFFSPPPPPSLL